MSEIAQVLLTFALQWSHPNYPATKVDPAKLLKSEKTLGVTLPEDYKSEILAAGLPKPTLALLSAIVDQEKDLYDLSELFGPDELVDMTVGWREVGLPENLIAFASDSSGNLFCFDATHLNRGPEQSAAVYFWDHEFKEVEYIAVSFSEFIASYTGSWSTGIKYDEF